jgi:NTE family protein
VLVLAEAGYSFPRVAGTSAGAIVASLVSAYQKAGRDLRELVGVMNSVQYSRFADGPLLGRMAGRLGEGVELLLHEGAHPGNYLVEWLGAELDKAGVSTFADLAIDDPGGSLGHHQRYSLVVHTSDLSRRALVRLPWDYGQYGKTADGERVVDAVRASMSIPFYFRPVDVKTATGTVTWVDGGLLSNFPVTVFDRTDGNPPRWPTWGIKLSGKPPLTRDRPVRGAAGIAVNCLETLTADWNRYRLDEEGVNRRTIFVDTTGVAATDFGIDKATRQRLYDNGQAAAQKFLANLPG